MCEQGILADYPEFLARFRQFLVIAREMQLPAVMSVRGAMSRFQNGQIVTVDGTSGSVRIED